MLFPHIAHVIITKLHSTKLEPEFKNLVMAIAYRANRAAAAVHGRTAEVLRWNWKLLGSWVRFDSAGDSVIKGADQWDFYCPVTQTDHNTSAGGGWTETVINMHDFISWAGGFGNLHLLASFWDESKQKHVCCWTKAECRTSGEAADADASMQDTKLREWIYG